MVRSGLWTWWLVTGAAAGASLFIEHVWPKLHIADGLWLWVTLVGVASGVFVAFHRVRLERDQGTREPVPPNHAEVLKHQLQSLALAIMNGATWEAPEEVEAHFPDLMPRLAEWSRLVESVAAASKALATGIANEAAQQGIREGEYEVDFVLAEVAQLVRERAAHGLLEDHPPPPLQWGYVQDLGGTLRIELARQQPPVASIPDPGGREVADTAVAQVTDRIDNLLSRAWTSAEARELSSAQRALELYREAFRISVVQRSQIERIRVSTDCPICRLNVAG
jgi:hypothetical protein